MATYTSRLNLKKPAGNELVSRSDMNDNYDKIDAGVCLNTNGRISNNLLIGGLASGQSIGQYSYAQGDSVGASGLDSHAEGSHSSASGDVAHAEGVHTKASADGSHVEGFWSETKGKYSHAEGRYTVASNRSQHVSGDYNVEDTSGDESTRGTYAEIIGNGTADNARSNARALGWDGNEYLNGDLYVNCNADSTGGTKVLTTPFVGAGSGTNGSPGLVPAPSAGDQTKFLCADGTWGNIAGASDMTGATASTPGVHGLVPAPAAGDQTKFLSGAGTWEPVGGASDMTGATASTNGVHGLVPAPMAGDQNKVLKGNGTWGTVDNNKFYLGNGMTYVETSTQTVPQNSSYTAPEDGFYSIYASAVDGSTSSGIWYTDSDRSNRLFSAVSPVILTIPLKAGTTIYTRKTSGEYRVYGYFKW